MDFIKQSLLLCFILFSSTVLAQKPPTWEEIKKKKKYTVNASVYLSVGRNNWGPNYWTNRSLSMTLYDNKAWTPNVTIWYDHWTKAKGIGLGVKLIDFKIKK